MFQRTKVVFVPATVMLLLFVVACSEGRSEDKSANAVPATPSFAPKPEEASSSVPQEDQSEDGNQSDAVSADEASVDFELQNIGAQTWTVLSGKRICVDESSLKRTCVEVGDAMYPNPSSLFLDVTVEVKNLGDVPTSLSAGDLIASYQGRTYRYASIEREDSTAMEVQPLAKRIIHSYYEVPVEVLNNATFSISLGSGEPIGFEFKTPRAKDEWSAADRARAADKEEDRKVADAETEVIRQKCSNIYEGETLTEDEFTWFASECPDGYDISTYDYYLKMKPWAH